MTIDEIKISGIFRYANTHKKAIEMITENKIDLKNLISKKFSLEDVKEALEYTRRNPDCIKVIVNP